MPPFCLCSAALVDSPRTKHGLEVSLSFGGKSAPFWRESWRETPTAAAEEDEPSEGPGAGARWALRISAAHRRASRGWGDRVQVAIQPLAPYAHRGQAARLPLVADRGRGLVGGYDTGNLVKRHFTASSL